MSMAEQNTTGYLYLIRHGQSLGGNNPSRCISRTDLPLDARGVHQADRLARWARDKGLTAVFSSPLRRAMDTARPMAGRMGIHVCTALCEMDVGEWEGLTFDDIRHRFPGDYTLRAEHPGTVAPTAGESVARAGARLEACLMGIAAQARGPVAVISHGGVIRGCLGRLMGLDANAAARLPLPWGSVSALAMGSGGLTVRSHGLMPDPWPGDADALYLLHQYNTPAAIIAHGHAVAETAARLAQSALALEDGLLRAACLLHDIARAMEGDHAAKGADILGREGYPPVAALIAGHHDLPRHAGVEADLLYLADKLVDGTAPVTLEARFGASMVKCPTAEAQAAWKRRYGAALAVAARYQLEV